ncbi:MAG: hypothetical protein ABJD06_07280, partial [Hyphomicrobiales bacterium]
REIIRAKPQNSAIRQFPPHENDNTAHACVFHSDALVIENMRKMRGLVEEHPWNLTMNLPD